MDEERKKYTISYNNIDSNDHTLDLQSYCDSLLGFQNLIKQINNANNPQQDIEIKIEANKAGSFVVVLLLSVVWNDIKPLFTGLSISEVMRLIFGEDGSILGLLRHLKGKKPDKISPTDNSLGKVIVNGNQESLTVTNNVYHLYSTESVKQALEKFSEVTEKEQVSDIEIITEDKKIMQEITKQDNTFVKDAIAYQNTNDDISIANETKTEMLLTIYSVTFTDGNKWRFYFGGQKISAYINDTAFMKKVHDKEISFTEGDTILAEVAISQSVVNKKIRLNMK